MRHPIPDDVRRFVLTRIPSVPFLEALLILRAESNSSWDDAALAQRLYIPQARAQELLTQLAEAGFARRDAESQAWRWTPEPELAGVVDTLAQVYAENLIGITELIHSRQDRRAQQFADAFRWRKD
jgi:hypothetical protein